MAGPTRKGPLVFHVIGDAYVDFFSFLDGEWPENGGDSRLNQPVKTYAGGSSTNTATHLKSLVRNLDGGDGEDQVILHTILNPNDHYGQLLIKHAKENEIPLVNCRQADDTSWTGHCIAIVSGGERSFMTHQGCVEHFTADLIEVEQIVATDGPVHVHVAGFYNVTGFWDGSLKKQLARIRREREDRFPNHSTTLSLVTQHDASKQWDGGLDDLVPYLDFLIMNELEANRIVRRGRHGKSVQTDNNEAEWMSFFSPLNPRACIIVTKGPQGAVAFRDSQVVATLSPAISVEAIDPTGAGDSFTAGFLHGIWASKRKEETRRKVNGEEWSPDVVKEGLQWGCAVGTAAVTIRGASNPSRVETIVDLYKRQKAKGS